MEIRSSSEESQLTMFTIKSRFPTEREPAMLFCATREVPTTTKRPCGEPLSVPATASVSGPFFPFVGSTALERLWMWWPHWLRWSRPASRAWLCPQSSYPACEPMDKQLAHALAAR